MSGHAPRPMRRLALLVLLAPLALAGYDGWPPTAAPRPARATGMVELKFPRVIDGSSLDGYLDGRRVAVGYRGVLTPQLPEPCGREALALNRQLVGRGVLLEEGPDGPQIDRYGRRLFTVYTAEGRSIELELVRAGAARSRSDEVARTAGLPSTEAAARAARRGCLWGER